jgi:MFS family permease
MTNNNDPSDSGKTTSHETDSDSPSDPNHEAPLTQEPEKQPQLGFFISVWRVLTYRSYSVYLATSWILGIFAVVIQNYIMLYLRDIFFDYILIGFILAVFMGLNLVTRFLGGYVGDNYNRKWLSVLTMLVSGIGMFVLSFTTALIWILVGIVILTTSELFASGSTSYIYENIPPDQSGLAMGIFQTGSGFGLIGLGLVTWFLGVGTPFITTIQYMLFIGGFCYVLAAIIRSIFLAPAQKIERKNWNGNKLQDFFIQNANALKLLLIILPVFMGILIIDALSDGFYQFVSMFYLNETLAFTIGEISLMLIVVLAFSIPLSVTVGGFFDRRGSRKAILIVYSVMPVSIALLLLAPIFPFWLPLDVTTSLISAFPILEPILSTAFLAMAMKHINDILWWTLILTYLRKAMPRSETAKMLSIFFIVVMLANIFTPIPAGYIYTVYGAIPLLITTLCLNLMIVLILVVGNIEPRTLDSDLQESMAVSN